MNFRRHIASTALALLALIFAGCGEDKNPPAPPADPPPIRSGQGGAAPATPEPAPPSAVPEKIPDSPASGSPPKATPITLLRPEAGDLTLFTQIRRAALAANLELGEISPAEFETLPTTESTLLLATLPFPADPQSEIQNAQSPPPVPQSAIRDPQFILVGTPESQEPLPPHLTHIRPDDREIGLIAGRWIVAALARQAESRGRATIAGNVVQIRASDESPASNLRTAGLLEILGQHAGVVFVHDGPGFWREADAKKRMEEALRIQKNIRAVFAHSDEMARGAASAIRAYRTQNPAAPEIAIISVGGDPKLAGLPTSTFNQSISLQPLAEKAIEIATRLRSDPTFRPPPEITVSPASQP